MLHNSETLCVFATSKLKKNTMENNYKSEKRAFIIRTTNNTYGEDKYVVIAETFSDADRTYLDELGGYHDIVSIEAIQDTKSVGVAKHPDRNTRLHEIL